MPATAWLLLVAAALAALVFLRPRFADAPLWRATVTPLASIIGSGFLIAGPILSEASGRMAPVAMLGLCGLGYLFGAAVRWNIATVEPLLKAPQPPRPVVVLERASDLVLAFAYFISVAYYLNLFAAFGLRAFGILDHTAIRAVTSAALLALAAIGASGGLKAFERIESLAVGLKLSVIAGLLAALLLASLLALGGGTLTWPEVPHDRGIGELQVVLGLVVLVQGFETSRYLGEEHNAEIRIRTMRWAQWISTGIYVVFLVLAAPYFGVPLPPEGGETAIIDVLRPLGLVVAPAITLAALASQMSAAVADLNGAGGLLGELPPRWLTERVGYMVTVAASLILTWSADIYQIITYASKAFVLYYGLQSAQAWLAARRGRASGLRQAVFAAGCVIAVLIVVLAAPASA